MTNNDDLLHDEHAHQHSDEGEWISSEPPVDDFSDPAAESATASEENEGGGDEAAVVAEPAPKKKSAAMLLASLVVLLAAGGGFAYWQFSAKEPSPFDVVAQNQASSPAAALPTASTPTQPSPFDAIPAPAAAPNLTSPATATPSNVVPAQVVEKPAAVPSPPVIVANNVAPTVDVAPVTQKTEMAAVPPSKPPVEAAPATDSTSTSLEARLTALSLRMDDMQKSISQTADQVTRAVEKMGTTASGDADVGTRLNKIEQKLADLEQRRPQATIARSSYSDIAPAPRRHAHKVAKSRAVAHKATTRRPSTASTTSWTLRAASPGEAWIARSADTRELRPVRVGDEVAGLGQVVAIRQQGGSWVVQGTSGVVR